MRQSFDVMIPPMSEVVVMQSPIDKETVIAVPGISGPGSFSTYRRVFVISADTVLGNTPNTDYIYRCIVPITVTMPDMIGNRNRYTVKRDCNAPITIVGTSGQTIDRASSFVVDQQLMSVDLVSDDTGWMVI